MHAEDQSGAVREEGWGFSQHDKQLFDVMGWFKLRYLEQLQIGYEAKAFSEFIELYSIRCKKGSNVSPSASPMRVSRPEGRDSRGRCRRYQATMGDLPGRSTAGDLNFPLVLTCVKSICKWKKWHSTRFAARRSRSKSNQIGKTSSRRGAHGKIIWIGAHRAGVASAMSVQNYKC